MNNHAPKGGGLGLATQWRSYVSKAKIKSN
jgi:hypothetical protein